MDSARSIRKARIASLILRSIETSLVSRKFLATCWVMVEAPTGRRSRAQAFDVGDHGADQRHEVDAGMGEEVLVLRRDEGVDHPLRKGLDRHEDPALAGIFRDQAAVAGMDPRRRRRP